MRITTLRELREFKQKNNINLIFISLEDAKLLIADPQWQQFSQIKSIKDDFYLGTAYSVDVFIKNDKHNKAK